MITKCHQRLEGNTHWHKKRTNRVDERSQLISSKIKHSKAVKLIVISKQFKFFRTRKPLRNHIYFIFWCRILTAFNYPVGIRTSSIPLSLFILSQFFKSSSYTYLSHTMYETLYYNDTSKSKQSRETIWTDKTRSSILNTVLWIVTELKRSLTTWNNWAKT